MVAGAWFLAYLTRYNFQLSTIAWPVLWQTLPVVITLQGLILWRFGLYRGVWRFASVPDLWNILRAAALGVFAIALTEFLINRLTGIPRTIFLLYPMYLVLLLGAPRLGYRIWKDYRQGMLNGANSKRVLILGAGRAGEMLARDMRRDGSYIPVGFLDDQPTLKGFKVHNLPVLGTIESLPEIAQDHALDLVIIALPSATTAQMRRVVEICEQAGIEFRTLPSLHDLGAGQPTVAEVREVNIEDLLGRTPITLDWNRISKGLAGQTVLVSGGGGSIGSELCRQIARLRPAAMVLFENNEYNLFEIERELRGKHPDLVLHAYLGDVRDRASVVRAFERFQPQMVFHAAAYTHVPMLESQAREAVRNNVLGTRLMAQTADRFGCNVFVMISTDKAVNPANVMGASKRVAEIYCQSFAKRSRTRFITVRFGNVLGSAGSVIPIFQKQIKAGGPVTVTHPDITRYFMTIPEASQLIMQAAVMGEGGEIFVLDMGEPVRIGYLAEQMIRLSGKTPGEDIEIVHTGLRPGEKFYEELFYAQEEYKTTGHDKILLAHSVVIDWSMLTADVRAIEDAVERYDEGEVHRLLKRIVPELAAQQSISNVVPFERASV
ncbi:MAG: polysaccharide biosynthesis protein [Gammaproteobacteria bacterium]|nr:polysaccharide biosynthesis protein [Gammaproteobacteria bacterium]